MRTSTLLLIFLTSSWISFGQHPSCDGTRYLNPVYTVDQTDGITFGNSTSFAGTNADLLLDFFEPSGDVAASRPLIILAFGGSFIGGSRDAMHAYCNYYAARGYACASIDYRLYDGPIFPLPDSVTMTDEVVKALSDMKAAIRFFKEDAATTNTYKVDPNFIIVGGISAGAIVAAHAGMLDSTDQIEPYVLPLVANNGGWRGNSSSNLEYSDDVMCVLNFSGALRSVDYIDPTDVPLFSVHDDMDDVVPYAYGYASIFGIQIISLEGSYLMHEKAQSVGLNSELITYAASNAHVSYFGNQTAADSILSRSLNFLYPQICGIGADVETLTPTIEFEMYPNPAQSSVTIELSNNQNFTLSIIDLSGRNIATTKNVSGKTVVSIAGFTPGMYLVEVLNEQAGISERKQLMIY